MAALVDATREVVGRGDDARAYVVVAQGLGGGRTGPRVLDALGAESPELAPRQHLAHAHVEPVAEQREHQPRVDPEAELQRGEADALVVRLPGEQLVGRHVDRSTVERRGQALLPGDHRHRERQLRPARDGPVADDPFVDSRGAGMGRERRVQRRIVVPRTCHGRTPYELALAPHAGDHDVARRIAAQREVRADERAGDRRGRRPCDEPPRDGSPAHLRLAPLRPQPQELHERKRDEIRQRERRHERQRRWTRPCPTGP